MMATNRIGKHKKVSLQYSLATGGGVVVRAATDKAIEYVHGCGTLFPKLEAALEGRTNRPRSCGHGCCPTMLLADATPNWYTRYRSQTCHPASILKSAVAW